LTALDLGTFGAPVLICGGAYGNLQALEALAAFQAGAGIADGNVIHTGDAVAYCADTEDATQFIAQRGWHSIKGNVEEQIASGAQDCGCGFEEGSACDVASARWYAHAVATLSDASKDMDGGAAVTPYIRDERCSRSGRAWLGHADQPVHVGITAGDGL
jgi:hypothetical protein